MADDIFLTQEEQDERAKRWLRENGPAILIGILLGLAGIYGYDEYRIYQIKQAEKASLAYSQVLERAESSELADISLQIDTLKDEFAGTPYAPKAALLKAKQLVATDLDAALQELEWVLKNADERPVWHTANIRKAKIYLAQNQADKAIEVASKLPYEGFASHYHEVLGDAYLQLGEPDKANGEYQKAIDALSPTDAGYARILTLKQNRQSAATDEVSSSDAADTGDAKDADDANVADKAAE